LQPGQARERSFDPGKPSEAVTNASYRFQNIGQNVDAAPLKVL